ncbi:MAG TPA: TolC family protein, partial [Puia sp.]|nr:TolC family protein [Puia sp.]
MNKRLRKITGIRTTLAAALLLLTMGTHAQQSPPFHELSLSQAIDYAAKNSAKVKNALLDYQIQEQSNRATTSQALPQVNASGGLTDYFQIPVSVVPGSFIGQPNVKLAPF